LTSFRARCLVYLGLGHSLRVKTLDDHARRRQLQSAAADCFSAAAEADPDDHLPRYYQALHAASERRTPAAAAHARAALDLHPDHQHSMHLMALLLSAQHEYCEALELTGFALEEYPESYPLLQLKVHLEEKAKGGESAILTAKGMLEQWQTSCENANAEEASVETAGNQLLAAFQTSHHPLTAQPQMGAFPLVGASAAVAAGVGAGAYDHANGFAAVRAGVAGSQAAFDALSDKDSVSLHAHSVTASHVEKTLSEVASSLSAPFPRPGER